MGLRYQELRIDACFLTFKTVQYLRRDVVEKHINWKQRLPRIRPFYSVKANSNQMLLKLLSRLGVGFDCVSEAEVKQVLELSVEPKSDIVFANPIKTFSQLNFLGSNNIDIMAFDNEDELIKIAKASPTARLLLRIQVEDSNSVQPIKNKYGCQLNNAQTLLGLAKNLKLNVVGICFHVGRKYSEPLTFFKAIQDAHHLFLLNKSEFGYDFEILNIGGGFPGAQWYTGDGDKNIQKDSFSKIATAVNEALDKYFPAELYPQLSIIAEPGTYYSSSAFSLTAQVIGKRVDKIRNANGEPGIYIQYYINDGVFGSLYGATYLFGYLAKATIPAFPIYAENRDTLEITRHTYPSTVWGHTTAPFDVVVKEFEFPEMEINEWILFKDVGDYSLSFATPFCGFKPTLVDYYINDEHEGNIFNENVLGVNDF